MRPKALPGTPWEGEISLGNFSGGPPEDNNEFFSAPGPPGAFSEPLGEAPGAKMAPGGLHFGSQTGAPSLHFWSLFGHLGALTCVPCRACYQASQDLGVGGCALTIIPRSSRNPKKQPEQEFLDILEIPKISKEIPKRFP